MTQNANNSLLITTPTRPTLRRYSLSDVGFMSSPAKERSKYSPMHEYYSSETSYKCTHIDGKSPGYATRVVQYNEEQQKSLPISQSRYNRPGIFPVVHFFKKDLPIKPIHSTPRMNRSADLSKYNTPEQNRMLLETIIQSSSPTRPASAHNNEVNTKSVLDALKEISRKRIHSEDDLLMNEDTKRACLSNYVTGSNLRKRPKLNSIQIDGPLNTKNHLGNYSSMDELKASFTSTDEQPLKKPKVQKIDVVPEPADTSFKSPSPIKSSDVETQTSQDVPEPKEPVIETKISNEESVNVEESSPQNKVKKILPVKIFDETPLETMRKNRLVALMGSLAEENVSEKQNIDPKSSTDTRSEKTVAERPLVSILAGSSKSPNRTTKHVTFNIPESSTTAESSNTSVSGASTDLNSRPEVNIITKTSAALVTPIVSSHVAEVSPIRKPEMSGNNQFVTSTLTVSASPKQESLAFANFKPTISSSSPSSMNSGQVLATNVGTQPTFSFENSFVMKPPTSTTNEQQSNINTNQTNQIDKPVFFSKPLESFQASSPKGGFKFDLNPHTITPATPFKISPSVSTVLTNSQQNNSKISTPTLGQVSSSSGASMLLPIQTAAASTGTVSSTTNSFQNSANGFNSTGFSLGNVFSSDKNKSAANVISLNFTTTSAENMKSANSTASTSVFKVQSPNANTSSNFMAPSTLASKPSTFMAPSTLASKPSTFMFPVNFKPATSIMFDPMQKPPLPNVSTTGQPVVAPSTNSAAPTFNKPAMNFNTTNVPFVSMFNGNNTGNSVNNPPSFATGTFNMNNSIFSGNNPPVNSSKPPFGQENTPLVAANTGSVFSNNTQTTNAFAPATKTFTPTTNAFATAKAFAPTTNAFAITTNAFANTTNAFAPTTNAFAPTTNSFAPTTNSFAPTTNAFAPTTNAFAPTTNAFASTTNSFAPTTNSFAPTTNSFAPTTNAFAPTTNVFAPTTNAFAPTTNAFAAATTTASNIFGNTSFGIPTTTAPTFSANPPSNFGTNTFGVNQNPGFNATATNATPVFGNLFSAANFPSSSAVFPQSNLFGNNAAAKGNNFKVDQPQGTNNTFGSRNFPVNPPTTQSEVFTFGVNSNKPAVFSFGSSEPSKSTFNFSGENNASTFGANNKGFGGAFTAAQPSPPQFNVASGTPGMFNIGIGTSTPNRSRTQLKAKRRT